MNKISCICPNCAKGMVDLVTIYPYDGYQNEKPYYQIKCYGCGISMAGVDDEELKRNWNKIYIPLHVKRFDFSERLKLQSEYREYLIEESAKIGACLDDTSVHTFISFLHSKNFEIMTTKEE